MNSEPVLVAQLVFDAMVVLLAVRVTGLLRGPAPHLRSASLLPVVEGPDVMSDKWVSVAQFPGRTVWGVVLSPGCQQCENVATALSEYQRRTPKDVTPPVITIVDGDFYVTEEYAMTKQICSPVLVGRDTGLLLSLRVNYAPQLIEFDAIGAVADRHRIDDFGAVIERIEGLRPSPAAALAGRQERS